MWPWEHAAVGYLLYSGSLRALGREPPTDRGALTVLLATQLPDLVDKPLSWGLGVFPTGYAVGHSAFVAVPTGVALLALGVRSDRLRLSAAFVVGYWSHLMADVMAPLRSGAAPLPGRVLWPIVTDSPYEEHLGIGRGVAYLVEFVRSAGSMDPLTLLVLYLLLPLAMGAVWVLDGAPGLPILTRPARALWVRLS